MKVVIVGGVAGGASAAARLRRLHESAEIIMFERGEYISFANCGLPDHIGGEITKKLGSDPPALPSSFNARFNVDVPVNSEVTSIDPKANRLATVRSKHRGEQHSKAMNKLILSPGAAPDPSSPWKAQTMPVYSLCAIFPIPSRSVSMWKRGCPASAVVVGGGYIGVEMAENLKTAAAGCNHRGAG